jgi:hypothetical protein
MRTKSGKGEYWEVGEKLMARRKEEELHIGEEGGKGEQ